ncbi:MAG: hypothetical protein ABJM58_08955 [Alteripontixanthobacter sp.]
MASIDGAYYFLTVLAPIRDTAKGGTINQQTAPMIQLRDYLAKMPTAMQTPASTASGKNSPFARSDMTHFARLSVVSQLGFNGTEAADPVLSSIGIAEPSVRHDDLKNHYLLFAAEFDAPSGSRERDRAVYLRDLWDRMEPELRNIFGHCVGFDEVETAADFITYIKRCEIDTTMPFNMYWDRPPELPTLNQTGLLIRVAGAAIAAGGGVWALLRLLIEAPQWLAITLAVFAAVIAAVWALAAILKHAGDRPFPRSPDGSLPDILKAMHIQQELSDFACQAQHATPDTLHRVFGDFLKEVKPSEPFPRQPPGQVYASDNAKMGPDQ